MSLAHDLTTIYQQPDKFVARTLCCIGEDVFFDHNLPDFPRLVNVCGIGNVIDKFRGLLKRLVGKSFKVSGGFLSFR